MGKKTHQSTFNADSSKPAHMAVLSADGVDMYVPQLNDRSIAHYKWDAAQQKIISTPDSSNYHEGAPSGDKTIAGLNDPWQVILSPDQRHVYVISRATGTKLMDTNTLALFERNTTNGELVFKAAYANNVGGITGIAAPTAMTLSTDGRSLYVVSETEQTLAVFRVDTVSGQLAFENSLKHGTTPDGLVQPSTVVVMPDGRFAYITDAHDKLVAIYARDTSDTHRGALTLISTFALDGLPLNMIASRDGAFLYISLFEGAIATLARNTMTGALSLTSTITNNTKGITALVNPYTLALSPDETKLLAGNIIPSSLVVFRRQPVTGELTFIEEHVTPELKGLMGTVFTAQGSHAMSVGTEAGIGIYNVATNNMQVTVKPPSTVPALGGNAIYHYEIKDVSRSSGATNLTLTASIPEGLDILSAMPSQGTCKQANKVLSCEFGGIDFKTSVILDLALTPKQAASVVFAVHVLAEQVDTQPGNNVVRVSLPYVAPVARDDVAIVVLDPSTNEQLKMSAQEIDVLANDSGSVTGEPLTIVQVDAISPHGTIKLVNGKLVYQPKIGYTGIDIFKYTMQDSSGNTAAPATVTVYVNTPPLAVDDRASVVAGESITVLVLANDTDVNFASAGFNDQLRVVTVESPSASQGIVTILDGGLRVTYTAPNDYAGEDRFAYTIDDGKGGRATATVRVNVTTGVVNAQQHVADISVAKNERKKGGAVDTFTLLTLFLVIIPRILSRRNNGCRYSK